MRIRVGTWAKVLSSILAAVSVGLSPASAGTVLAHWDFNEGKAGRSASASADAIVDSSGNAHHLTAIGSPLPQYTAGPTLYGDGSALKFSAGTDRLQLTETSSFNFDANDSFTLETVLRVTKGAVFTGNIVGRDWGSNLPSWWFRLESGAPRFLLAQAGGSASSVTANARVNDGEWHHVAAVRDAEAHKLRVYVDYTLAGEANDTTTTAPTNSQKLVVAAFNNGSRQFEGEIDFLRISQGALFPAGLVQTVLAIVDLQPTNGSTFAASSNLLSFTIASRHGVDPANIQLALNGRDCSEGLVIKGTESRREVRFAGLAADQDYQATISVVDRRNNQLKRQVEFDTYEGHSLPLFVRGESGYHTYRIPALLTGSRGTLLAFAEARKNSGSDAGDIDLVLKRSVDLGKTWSAMQVIWSDGVNTIGNPCPVLDESTGKIWLPFCRNNRRVFVTCSADDGETWDTPREITSTTKLGTWGWYATGPGVGIQLKQGPSRGRMVIPCDFSDKSGSNRIAGSHVIYSDDHGETWKLGGLIAPGVNECQVVELADGRLLMNMRNAGSGQKTRALATSSDGGWTWSAITHDAALVEPICQASLLRYTHSAHQGKNRLVFSNPASTSSRTNLAVRLSYDEGRTWPVTRTLHFAASAYSCLAVLPDMSLGCLHEAGARSPYETITFTRFNLTWLTSGTDRIANGNLKPRSQGAQMPPSWPAEFAGARIESSSNANLGQRWTALDAKPSVVEDGLQLMLEADAPHLFFRLTWTSALAAGFSSVTHKPAWLRIP
jgi:sialidase-1